jgi:hypothetical protein
MRVSELTGPGCHAEVTLAAIDHFKAETETPKDLDRAIACASQLVDMGFPAGQALVAVIAASFNVNEAAEELMK